MQCPGQDSRYWDNEAIFEANCSKCGAVIEFFKDDNKRKCKQCGHEMLNPKIDFGCASYCPYAEQCLGSLPPEMVAQKQELLVDRIAIEAKKMLDQDFAKIGLMTKAARFAEKILKTDESVNRAVVMVAVSFLPFVLAPSAGEGQETAIEQVTTKLTSLNTNPGIIAEVCEILADPRKTGADSSMNQRVVHDSLVLAEMAGSSAAQNDNIPELLTETARQQAEQLAQRS